MIETTLEHRPDSRKDLLDAQWELSQRNAVIKALQSGQELPEILEGLPGFEEAFLNKLDVLDCADGRVCSGHKMGLAGVGILLSPVERLMLERVIHDKGLIISGHENCGAAGLAFPGPDSDQHGYENARDLALKTDNVYKEVHKPEFRCEVHNERALVLEATGRFDAANLEGFPVSFISSAPALDLPDAYTKKEIVALTKIALAENNFGARFDAASPFYIVVSAENPEQLQQLMALSREAVSEFGDRVAVKGFVAPEKKEE